MKATPEVLNVWRRFDYTEYPNNYKLEQIVTFYIDIG